MVIDKLVKLTDVLRELSTEYVNQSAIAKRFNVTRQRIYTLAETLQRMGLIEKNRNGKIRLNARGQALVENTPRELPQPYEDLTRLLEDGIGLLITESEDEKKAQLETFLVDYALHSLFLAVMVEAANASNMIKPGNIEETLNQRWEGKLKDVMAWTANLLLACQNHGWAKLNEIFTVMKHQGEYSSHILDKILAERLTQNGVR